MHKITSAIRSPLFLSGVLPAALLWALTGLSIAVYAL